MVTKPRPIPRVVTVKSWRFLSLGYKATDDGIFAVKVWCKVCWEFYNTGTGEKPRSYFGSCSAWLNDKFVVGTTVVKKVNFAKHCEREIHTKAESGLSVIRKKSNNFNCCERWSAGNFTQVYEHYKW